MPYTTITGIQRSEQIQACTLDGTALKSLYDLLVVKAREAADRIVNAYPRTDIETDESFAQAQNLARQLLDLSILIIYPDGQRVRDPNPDTLLNLPKTSLIIEFDSSFHYRQRAGNKYLDTYFLVSLDFSKTNLLDLKNPSHGPTPNSSQIELSSSNNTWANGIIQELNAFFTQNSNARDFLHTHYIYDLLLFAVGFPISFLWVYHIYEIFSESLVKTHSVFAAAIYIYVFMASLYIFRLGFNFFRYLWPKIEWPRKLHIKIKLLNILYIGILLTWLLYPLGVDLNSLLSIIMSISSRS